MLKFFIKYLIISLIILFAMLLAVSFFTLLERKILGGIQRRHGPIFTGYFGILQPFADGLKLFLKEVSIPAGGYYYVFLISSMLSLALSLLSWSVIPFNSKFVIADLNFGMLFLLFISSLNVYATLFSGWSSNSKFGLLGSIRSGAQMISYELPMTLSLLPIALYTSSFNLTNIVIFQQHNFWFIFFLPAAYIYFVTALAETNRTPFDLPEAESELVAGYNIEYSSLPFAFFFLAEYNHMLAMSFLFSILFLGGWSNFSTFFITEETFSAFYWAFLSDFFESEYIHFFFSVRSTHDLLRTLFFYSNETIETSILMIKALLMVLLFISVRAVLPRYKYIQLIKLCWSVFIPVLLFYVTLVTYAYAGTNIMNSSAVYRDIKYEAALKEIDEWYANATVEQIFARQLHERQEESEFLTELTGNVNHDWVKSDAYHSVWTDKRFMKYLMVKFNYVEDYYNPLEALIWHMLTNYEDRAYLALQEYYTGIEYYTVFHPEIAPGKNVMFTSTDKKEIALSFVKGITDERLLELYFGIEEGHLIKHPDNYGYVQFDRYTREHDLYNKIWFEKNKGK